MTSGKASREARELKAAERRAAVARAESRRKNSVRIAVAVVVVLVVVGFGALVQSQRGGSSAGDTAANPANSSGTANAVVTVGQASAKVPVTIYLDFQCPFCQQFETSAGAELADYVAKGDVKVEYHPIAFLDDASTTKYSTRALNAAACVVNGTPTAYQKFSDLLFANQPKEGSAGLPDSQLASLAKQAGAGDVSQCITDRTYEGWTKRVTDQASKDKVNSTPTVLVGGTQLQQPTAAALKTAVDAALKG
ncbi:thioredoxin domain-containing protein [Angustibacter peucedani]